MFDLEKQIKDWRQQLLQRESVGAADVDELESHLRETVEELGSVVRPDEAFLLASRRVGSPDAIALEFSKINGARTWTRRTQWMLAGYLVMSFGLGLLGTLSRGAMTLAAMLDMPVWLAGAFSSLSLVVGILAVLYWVWSVTNGNSLGVQRLALRFANYAKTGKRWWFVAGVLLVLILKSVIGQWSYAAAARFLQPKQMSAVWALAATSGWVGNLIFFGTLAALLCWLIKHDGESGSLTRSKAMTIAVLVAVLVFVAYGLVLASMPALFGSHYSFI